MAGASPHEQHWLNRMNRSILGNMLLHLLTTRSTGSRVLWQTALWSQRCVERQKGQWWREPVQATKEDGRKNAAIGVGRRIATLQHAATTSHRHARIATAQERCAPPVVPRRQHGRSGCSWRSRSRSRCPRWAPATIYAGNRAQPWHRFRRRTVRHAPWSRLTRMPVVVAAAVAVAATAARRIRAQPIAPVPMQAGGGRGRIRRP